MIKHGPWAIEKSIKKYEGNRIVLIEDEVIRPDGEHGKYATVHIQPGVCVLPMVNESVFLVKEFRYAVGRETIEAVGGTIDEGEEAAAAAKRELKEELGIEAAELIGLGHIDPVTSVLQSRTQLFLARQLTFVERNPDDAEKIERVKLSFDDALRMSDRNEITHAETCALLCRASRYLSR
jgi:ADP-ribose pyrophosphatase